MAQLQLALNTTQADAGVKRFQQGMVKIKQSAAGAERALDKFGRNSAKSINRTSVAAGRARIAMTGLQVAASAVAAALAGKSGKVFVDYATSIAEVSTLIQGSTKELDLLNSSAKRLAATYGGSAQLQAEAFYQAISAGIGGVSDAAAFLETANILAVGGVTDIVTSVDVLTSVLNAYSGTLLTAEAASDILFTGVKVGKTTVDQLSASIGKVAPVARALEIPLQELVGVVATLTASGLDTSESITGLKAALANIIKPAQEAREEAKRLGVQFGADAILANGFSNVIKDVIQASGGSQTIINRFFGSIEAGTVITSLSINNFKTLDAAMLAMADSGGAAQVAFDKINDSITGRLNIQLAQLNNHMVEIGKVVISGVVPALEVFNEHIDLALFGVTALSIAGVALGVTLLSPFFAVTAAVVGLGAAGILLASNLRSIGYETSEYEDKVISLNESLETEIKLTEDLRQILASGQPLDPQFIAQSKLELVLRQKKLDAVEAERLASYRYSQEYENALMRKQALEQYSVKSSLALRDANLAIFHQIEDNSESYISNSVELGKLNAALDNQIAKNLLVRTTLKGNGAAIVSNTASIKSATEELNELKRVLDSTIDVTETFNLRLRTIDNALELGVSTMREAVDLARQLGIEMGKLSDNTGVEDAFNDLRITQDPKFAASEKLKESNAVVDNFLNTGGRDSGEIAIAAGIKELAQKEYEETIKGLGAGRVSIFNSEEQKRKQEKSSFESLRSTLDPEFKARTAYDTAKETLDAGLSGGLIEGNEVSTASEQYEELLGKLNESKLGFESAKENASSLFTSILTGAKSGSEAISELAQNIAKKLGNSAFNSIIGNLFGGGGAASGIISGLFGFEKGGVFDKGNVVPFKNGATFNHGRLFENNVIPFAKGDVFDQATPFQFNGGQAGELGEAGPEAIIPLKRGSDGKLGISGGGSSNTNINQMTYAPVVDARGASNESIENLTRELRRQSAEFDSRWIKTHNNAKEDKLIA